MSDKIPELPGHGPDRNRAFGLVLAAFLSLGLAQVSQANLLSNPGFETGDETGWALSGIGEALCLGDSSFFGGASDGACAMQFNGGNNPPDAVLEQAFVTSAGATYQLAFDIGMYSQSSAVGTSSLLVELLDNGVSLAGFPLSAEDSTQAGGPNLPMQPGDFVNFVTTFTATGVSTLLRITDQATDGGLQFDTMLDNFSIVEVTVVPPAIVHSPLDDGLTRAVAALPVDGTPLTLNLYLSRPATPSAAGTACDGTGLGDETCGWDALIATTGGATLTDFVPDGDVVFRLDPTLLRANGGDFDSGSLSSLRLGTLTVTADAPGSVTVDGYQVVTSRLTGAPVEPGTLAQSGADDDADGVVDSDDNCTAMANPDQRDTDGDNIGNACDPDIAPQPNDCLVNFLDLNIMKANFFASGDLDTDFNGDGQTNFIDLNILKTFFFGPPGPSNLANDCVVPQ